MGLNVASRAYDAPKANFKRRFDGRNIIVIDHVQAFGRSTDLPKEMEDEIAKHVLLLEERFFGLTMNDMQRLAFQMAVANSLYRFNRERGTVANKRY
jgi:hypothetical protein